MIKKELVALDVDVKTAEEAIRYGGSLLEKGKLIHKEYTEAMVQSLRELGPYIVISPLVAIPHASPGDNVIKTGMSFARLKNPVEFGHPTNDPVQILICLASTKSNDHIELIKSLASVLGKPENIETMISSKNTDEIVELFRRKED